MELKIDAEFESKIPPLTEEEFMQLESNIVSDGIVINPIITWKSVIVDGHNRYRIIRKHPAIKFTTHEKAFADRYEAIAWICKNQLGRRNLTLEQKNISSGSNMKLRRRLGVGCEISNWINGDVSPQNAKLALCGKQLTRVCVSLKTMESPVALSFVLKPFQKR